MIHEQSDRAGEDSRELGRLDSCGGGGRAGEGLRQVEHVGGGGGREDEVDSGCAERDVRDEVGTGESNFEGAGSVGRDVGWLGLGTLRMASRRLGNGRCKRSDLSCDEAVVDGQEGEEARTMLLLVSDAGALVPTRRILMGGRRSLADWLGRACL